MLFLVLLVPGLAGEEEKQITRNGITLSVTEKGVFTLTDESGVRFFELLQFRPLIHPDDRIVSYAPAMEPTSIEVKAEDEMVVTFESPPVNLVFKMDEAGAEEGVPPATSLLIKPGNLWKGGLRVSGAARPLPSGFVLPGRIQYDGTSRITGVSYAGTTQDYRTDTLYDAKTDRAIRFVAPPGRLRAHAKRFDVAVHEDGYRLDFIHDLYRKGKGIDYFSAMDRTRFTAPPSGWCTWYFYYLNITEQEMKKNTDWMAEHLKPYGLEYVQLDDGFQLLAGDGEQAESWTEWNEKFPSGHEEMAGYIHDKGFKAGLWLTPFSQGSDALVQAHPDWFLRDEDGEVVKTFKGSMTLDASNDGVLEGWFGPLFTELSDWDYYKIDGQTTVIEAYRRHAERFAQSMSGDEAYRRGVGKIRETIGDDRFLLNCWGTVPEGIGIVNGARTGGDIWASWQGLMPAKRATEDWYYTHNICWYTDPDTVLVRPPLTFDQAKVWVSLVGLTGQLLMASDKMYELPEERVELLRRIYPALPLYPMEFYPLGEDQLDIIDLKVNKTFYKWDVIGLFNWDRKDKIMGAGIKEIGRRLRTYALYDFWEGKFLGLTDGSFFLNVPKQGCRVFSLMQAFPDRPTLLATSRHITMGGLDLTDYRWNSRERNIRGISDHLVAGEPYTLTFYLPDGLDRADRVVAEGAETEIRHKGRIEEIVLTPSAAGRLSWEISFQGETFTTEGRTCGVPVQTGEPELTPSSAAFRWVVNGDHPSSFRVERNGLFKGTTFEGLWVDRDLEPGEEYIYKVSSQPFQGQYLAEDLSFTLTVKTPLPPPPPPEPDVYLSELEPLSAEQGWGELKRDTATEGNKLTIGGEAFEKGLGTHAVSRIEYAVEPRYAAFTAFVGVDGETPYGSVTFEVWLDGEKVFETPLLCNGDPPFPVHIDVQGRERLLLVVTDGGDNINYDHADWARAGFVKKD
jgi:hypothetical protein